MSSTTLMGMVISMGLVGILGATTADMMTHTERLKSKLEQKKKFSSHMKKVEARMLGQDGCSTLLGGLQIEQDVAFGTPGDPEYMASGSNIGLDPTMPMVDAVVVHLEWAYPKGLVANLTVYASDANGVPIVDNNGAANSVPLVVTNNSANPAVITGCEHAGKSTAKLRLDYGFRFPPEGPEYFKTQYLSAILGMGLPSGGTTHRGHYLWMNEGAPTLADVIAKDSLITSTTPTAEFFETGGFFVTEKSGVSSGDFFDMMTGLGGGSYGRFSFP